MSYPERFVSRWSWDKHASRRSWRSPAKQDPVELRRRRTVLGETNVFCHLVGGKRFPNVENGCLQTLGFVACQATPKWTKYGWSTSATCLSIMSLENVPVRGSRVQGIFKYVRVPRLTFGEHQAPGLGRQINFEKRSFDHLQRLLGAVSEFARIGVV